MRRVGIFPTFGSVPTVLTFRHRARFANSRSSNPRQEHGCSLTVSESRHSGASSGLWSGPSVVYLSNPADVACWPPKWPPKNRLEFRCPGPRLFCLCFFWRWERSIAQRVSIYWESFSKIYPDTGPPAKLSYRSAIHKKVVFGYGDAWTLPQIQGEVGGDQDPPGNTWRYPMGSKFFLLILNHIWATIHVL